MIIQYVNELMIVTATKQTIFEAYLFYKRSECNFALWLLKSIYYTELFKRSNSNPWLDLLMTFTIAFLQND